MAGTKCASEKLKVKVLPSVIGEVVLGAETAHGILCLIGVPTNCTTFYVSQIHLYYTEYEHTHRGRRGSRNCSTT